HYTGSPLHAASAGEGWFSVQAQNGEEAYTRSGEFAVGADNMLVTQLGLPVMSVDGAPIDVPERGSITIASDGTITALGAGDNPADLQIIGQLKLVNPPAETLVRGDDGLFRVVGEQPVAPADPTVRLASGYLEGSNVNTAENMVALISNARQFELQMKVIQDASTNAERANSILSV